MAEYAYNNSKQLSTKISLFYANYGFEPQTNWPTKVQFSNPASELYRHDLNKVHETLTERLEESVGGM
jgi:hypothetical protein